MFGGSSLGTSLGLVQYLGLAGALALIASALAVLWAARHRAHDERALMPVVGAVGNPTCLTLGICLLVCSYHAAAYSLAPVVSLVAVPMDRWWLLLAVCAVAVGGSLLADRLESRESEIP